MIKQHKMIKCHGLSTIILTRCCHSERFLIIQTSFIQFYAWSAYTFDLHCGDKPTNLPTDPTFPSVALRLHIHLLPQAAVSREWKWH